MVASIIVLIIMLVVVFGILLLKYRNKLNTLKEEINNARSNVRIAKAKYLQVLKKATGAQKEVMTAQGEAYNASKGDGALMSGAIGNIDNNFRESSDLVLQLANDYENAQKKLNTLVNKYNSYLIKFPSSLFASILRYKKEEYIDNDNLNASGLLQGFDEEDL